MLARKSLTWFHQDAPVPAGRSVVSCRKLLVRLKAKHKDDIEKIKAGQSLGTTTEAAGGDGESTPGRKRKDKADSASNDNEDSEASPKKKRAGRPKKPSNTVKEEEIEEEDQEED